MCTLNGSVSIKLVMLLLLLVMVLIPSFVNGGEVAILDLFSSLEATQGAVFFSNYKAHGAPVVLATAPWTSSQQDLALARGSHKPAQDYLEFLRSEMADMIEKSHWAVLPFEQA